jgi:hypothetical protein
MPDVELGSPFGSPPRHPPPGRAVHATALLDTRPARRREFMAKGK